MAIYLTSGLPMGSSHDLDTAKAEADQLANLEQPFDLLLHRGRWWDNLSRQTVPRIFAAACYYWL